MLSMLAYKKKQSEFSMDIKDNCIRVVLCYAQNSPQASTIKYKFPLTTHPHTVELSLKYGEKKVHL